MTAITVYRSSVMEEPTRDNHRVLASPTAPREEGRALALSSAIAAYAKFKLSDTTAFDESHESAKSLLFTTLDSQIKHVFDNAIGIEFEDGMESEFSRAIVAIIEEHGTVAVDELTKLIAVKILDAEVISEALRWIGSMDDANTHKERRGLLEACMQNSSYLVRDGAICGLSCLGDAASTGAVRQAMAVESYPQLTADFQQLLVDLEHPD